MSIRTPSLIFFMAMLLGVVLSACGGAAPSVQNDSGQASSQVTGQTASGPIGWTILPQFPPRSQVISRRLLGLNDLIMVDENNGWVVGTDGGIGRTSDGGDTFKIRNPKDGEFLTYRCLSVKPSAP